jgi:hypothetical protein
MNLSRKTTVTLAAALTGVLGMAGVAAAARGGAEDVRREDRPANTTTSVTTDNTVTRTTEVEHPRPEPGDDKGVDPAGHDVNDVNDDNGVDPAGHDVNDDHSRDDVTVNPTGNTLGNTPTTIDDHGGRVDDHSGPGRGVDDHTGSGHGGDDD